MKILFDYFPIILFFILYKFYTDIPPESIELINNITYLGLTAGESSDAIYLATAAAILASFVQVAYVKLSGNKLETLHWVSLGLITVFGGMTLILQDPVFIQWKPTIINWLMAVVFFASALPWFGGKSLVQRMMEQAIENAPAEIWNKLNLAWVMFFIVSGALNLIVAYNFSEDTWVNFKLFGLLGLTVVFVILQALYLAKHMPKTQES